MANGPRGPMKCSWCGRHYGYRYGWDGSNIFVYTWDFLTFFWFWWHPHFCSNDCKIAYQERKGSVGIMRDIDFIKSVILFFKKPNKLKLDTAQNKTTAEHGFIHTQQYVEADETSEKLTLTNQNE